MFDVGNIISYENIHGWRQSIIEACSNIKIVLVETKWTKEERLNIWTNNFPIMMNKPFYIFSNTSDSIDVFL